MKKIFSILLFIAFVFQSTSCLWIMASFYAQREYISKNLCINRFDAIPVCKGQCYLVKQLKENEKREQNLPDLKQKEIHLFYQNNIFFEFENAFFQSQLNALYNEDNSLSSDFLYSVFHPPKIA